MQCFTCCCLKQWLPNSSHPHLNELQTRVSNGRWCHSPHACLQERVGNRHHKTFTKIRRLPRLYQWLRCMRSPRGPESQQSRSNRTLDPGWRQYLFWRSSLPQPQPFLFCLRTTEPLGHRALLRHRRRSVCQKCLEIVGYDVLRCQWLWQDLYVFADAEFGVGRGGWGGEDDLHFICSPPWP